jgi:hypothetical protein
MPSRRTVYLSTRTRPDRSLSESRGTGKLIRTVLPQANAYAMIRRLAAAAGIATKLGNHSFRATGITAYLKNGGTLEMAAAMANPRNSTIAGCRLGARRRFSSSSTLAVTPACCLPFWPVPLDFIRHLLTTGPQSKLDVSM